MTYDNSPTEDSLRACGSKTETTNSLRDDTITTTKPDSSLSRPDTLVETIDDENPLSQPRPPVELASPPKQMPELSPKSTILSDVCLSEAVVKKDCNEHSTSECNNYVLNDEIKTRLEKLNALSDLINSLECQFDEANSLFRETLKCSTDRLISIAKTLGSKSIRQGRVYRAAKLSVEQSQSDCQRACVQFEQANKDHQVAKDAIRDAEMKLKKVASCEETSNSLLHKLPDSFCIDSIDFNAKLKLTENEMPSTRQVQIDSSTCDTIIQLSNCVSPTTENSTLTLFEPPKLIVDEEARTPDAQATQAIKQQETFTTPMMNSAAQLSEELNQAILGLIEAERKRSYSEMQHLTEANKLMVAQENLTRLEREYGPSVKRAQLYFDEARRFDVRLSSVKGDISRISEDISIAKQAYARTLSELERFSDDLHDLKTRAHSRTTS